jgi:TolB-like protein/tetratricopeptide (TPR) repeat protein/tRNA A-37 threonylcarbamoyl transferase component Bud32
MSRVFVAEDTRLGRRIVVKVLHPDLAADVSAARFEREIRLSARLQHPHIVPLLSAGDLSGLPYYTMPFVEGESLRARLSREGALSVADALRLIRELADGLAYAHDHGVIHRDLKPENVLLSARHAMVTDFGVAKALSVATQGATDGITHPEMTRTTTALGVAVGTPAYMAPEQAAGDPATDYRADLYALGIIAYEALAGEHPYSGRSPQGMIAAHLTESPAPITERRRDLPPAVAELVSRLLEKRAADRPKNAAEVMAVLDEITPPTGSNPPTLVAAKRSRPRRRLAIAAAVVVAFAVIALAAIGFRRKPGAQQPVLAVLPFENLGQASDAYFADGLTDEVTSRLAGVSGLRVIGRVSALQYKGSHKTPREIGDELGANYLLTGTVRWERSARGSGRVRVSPQLVRASDQSSVWGEPYEGPLSDVFSVQTNVAERVAAAMDVALLSGEHQTVAVRPTSNLAAYDAYLRGLASSTRADRFAPARIDAAVAEFSQAVALDPNFAAAHAHLALAHLDRRLITNDDSATFAGARASAERAVALDPTLPDAQFALASTLRGDADMEGAYAAASAASKAAPSNTQVLYFLGELDEILGHIDRASANGLRAIALDPRSPDPPAYLAGLYDRIGRHEEAIQMREREIALSPNNALAYVAQASSYLVWRADTLGARRVLERGGSGVIPWMIAFPGAHGPISLWESSLTNAGRVGKDTLTYAGFTRNGIGTGLDRYYLLKLRHFLFSGRRDRARVEADSIVRALEPEFLRSPDAPPAFRAYPRAVRRIALAEAYAMLGRSADAARESDRYATDVRRRREGGDFGGVEEGLANAAYVDVLSGRDDRALAKLNELAARPTSGEWISSELLRSDLAWAPLRGQSDFQKLIAKLDSARFRSR